MPADTMLRLGILLLPLLMFTLNTQDAWAAQVTYDPVVIANGTANVTVHVTTLPNSRVVFEERTPLGTTLLSWNVRGAKNDNASVITSNQSIIWDFIAGTSECEIAYRIRIAEGVDIASFDAVYAISPDTTGHITGEMTKAVEEKTPEERPAPQTIEQPSAVVTPSAPPGNTTQQGKEGTHGGGALFSIIAAVVIVTIIILLLSNGRAGGKPSSHEQTSKTPNETSTE
jgi:hypothetical protein